MRSWRVWNAFSPGYDLPVSPRIHTGSVNLTLTKLQYFGTYLIPRYGADFVMSNDLIISATGPPAIDRTVEQKGIPYQQAPAVPPALAAGSLPNPSMRLDSKLALVVLEFHNDTGVVTNSIPSQQQLQAYRSAQQTTDKPVTQPPPV